MNAPTNPAANPPPYASPLEPEDQRVRNAAPALLRLALRVRAACENEISLGRLMGLPHDAPAMTRWTLLRREAETALRLAGRPPAPPA